MTIVVGGSELVAVIPVRAGSKGLPGKNARLLNGSPLYMHAVLQGLRSVGRVILSTDIAEIQETDLPRGCSVCWRPPELAADDTLMASVIEHLIEECSLHRSNLVLLQATSPLRADMDVNAAVELFAKGQHDLVMSVVERDRGVLKYGTLEGCEFFAMRHPELCFQNRQRLPAVFGPNGAVYVFSAHRFLENKGFPSARIGAVVMPPERSVDIDTLQDFFRVEEAMANTKQD